MKPAGPASQDEAVLAYDTNAKMYLPLRAAEDAAACIDGLRDGTIDAIATDHAPHAVQEKVCEFDAAATSTLIADANTALDGLLLATIRGWETAVLGANRRPRRSQA